jgi:hypothetical protein
MHCADAKHAVDVAAITRHNTEVANKQARPARDTVRRRCSLVYARCARHCAPLALMLLYICAPLDCEASNASKHLEAHLYQDAPSRANL